MIRFRRMQPEWGLGTVYYVLDVGRHQFSVRFMPWKILPRFTHGIRRTK